MQFINTIYLRQALHVSFSFIADFSNLPRWNYAVIKTEQISEGSIGRGTLFRQERKFMGRTLIDTFRITEFKVDSIISIKSIKAEYPFSISYSFAASANGTAITNSFELEGVVNPFGFLWRPVVKKAVAENLSKLKELVERL